VSNRYLDEAKAASDVLTDNWFDESAPARWVPGDYWKTPTICAELATFMSLSGTTEHLDICNNAIKEGDDYLTSSAYLDDATCWGRLGLIAYRWLGGSRHPDATTYLEVAGRVAQDLVGQWGDACEGGLYWMREPDEPKNFKAANSTLGFMDIALGLHFAQDTSQDWLKRAQEAWGWILAKKLVGADGLVWGGLTRKCAVDQNNVPVIALQGGPLVPLWNLYRATGDSKLLDAAERIADGALTSFTWPGSSVIATPFDGNWAGQNDEWRADHTNDTLFKGVFVAALAPLTAGLAAVPGRREKAARYASVLRANADALARNYPGRIYGMDWHTPSPSYRGGRCPILNACLQFSALAAFNAAAQVAAIS